MDFELPEEIRLLKDTVRKFVDRELIPIEIDIDGRPRSQAGCPRRARGQGEGARTVALDVPEDHGGQGLSFSAWRSSGRRSHAPSPCRRAGPAFSAPTCARCCFSSMPRRRSTISSRSFAARRRLPSPRPSPMPAPIPGPCARPRSATATITSSTAASASSRFAADADFVQLVAATDRAKGSRGGLSVFLVDKDTPGVQGHAQDAQDDGRRRPTSSPSKMPRCRSRTASARRARACPWRRAGSPPGGSIRPAAASAWRSAASNWRRAMPSSA